MCLFLQERRNRAAALTVVRDGFSIELLECQGGACTEWIKSLLKGSLVILVRRMKLAYAPLV